jgi:DnaD/phage-associated family protein
MPEFKGFPDGKVHQTPIPATFFQVLLPMIDDLGELKLTLYVFWRLDHMEGPFRFLRRKDLIADELLLNELGSALADPQTVLRSALSSAVGRGTLLETMIETDQGGEEIYFLNSPKGRAALRAIKSGRWQPSTDDADKSQELEEPPNVFRLYEENIGALTPMIADSLVDAEATYPLAWIEEAIEISVQNNKRNWRYVLTILERWQREGKHGRKEKPEDRPDSEKVRRRYVEGEFSDFIEH